MIFYVEKHYKIHNVETTTKSKIEFVVSVMQRYWKYEYSIQSELNPTEHNYLHSRQFRGNGYVVHFKISRD